MISLQKNLYRVCLAGLFSFTGCHRDIPLPSLQEKDTRNITFKLSGFESEITPSASRVTKRFMGQVNHELRGVQNIVPDPEPQHIYYWSFNDETLTPDIAVDEQEATISFEASTANPDFVNGFALDPFEAGRALSIRGPKSLVINLPLGSVKSLGDLSFDIKSSDTGPKDFAVSYSADGGNTFTIIRANNQFEHTGSAQRNQYTFSMGSFFEAEETASLQLKLDFREGDRGLGGAYSEVRGTVHLDNIRLSGVYDSESAEEGGPSVPETLRYYVFASDDGRLVTQQELAIDQLGADGSLTIKLAEGFYDVLFFAYRSEKGLHFPTEITHASEFYCGQQFVDDGAITYAVIKDDFAVGEDDTAESVVLTRCFSAIKFKFSDAWADLTKVKKIEITRRHANYLYTPFGMPAGIPEDERNTISLTGLESEDDYEVMFHQFLGILDTPQQVSYELKAFGVEGEVLNTLIVNERIQNNSQLLFRGKLLGDVDHFSIAINPDWDETIEHKF